MSEFLKAQVEERQKLWHEAKAVIETAEAEGRSLSGEEEQKFQNLNTELDRRAAFIEDARKVAEREERFAAAAESFTIPTSSASSIEADIRALARGEKRGLEFGHEKRALAPATTGAPIPTSFYDEIIMKAQFVGPMLTTSKLLRTSSGEPLQIPSVATYSTGTLTAAGSVLPDTDPTLNAFKTLQSWKYGGLVRVARELIEDSAVDLQGFLSEQIGIGMGQTINAVLTNGTGTTQPFGIAQTASTAITGGTGVSGAFTADNIIDLVFSLDSVARRAPGAGFMMNRAGIANARKLKDGYGRYIFEPSLSADKQDLLLGYNLWENPDLAAPATSAASVLFGDLGSYFVREVGGIRLDTSADFAFANDQIVFRWTWRGDGNLIQTSHVKKFTGGAS
jgi:HK97 family phage major capsid protein